MTALNAARNFARQGRKIVCVGRNYTEHIEELKNETPTSPVIFLKPTTSYLPVGTGNIKLPSMSNEVHQEVELCVVIGKDGKNITEGNAMSYVGGYCVGLDLTCRDLQGAAKKKGLPWTIAKGFDTFAPVGEFIEKEKVKNPHQLNVYCEIGGEMKQNGDTNMMIYRIPYLLHYISTIMKLETGDIIMTGTPAGVGPIKSGDKIRCGLKDNANIITEACFSVE